MSQVELHVVPQEPTGTRPTTDGASIGKVIAKAIVISIIFQEAATYHRTAASDGADPCSKLKLSEWSKEHSKSPKILVTVGKSDDGRT